MSAKYDLRGREFGWLTVINEVGRTASLDVIWLCRCSCGKSTKVTTNSLVSRRTQSCGCLRNAKSAVRSRARSKRVMPQPTLRYEGGTIEDLEDLIR